MRYLVENFLLQLADVNFVVCSFGTLRVRYIRIKSSCVENKIKVPMPKVKVTIRSEVKILYQH